MDGRLESFSVLSLVRRCRLLLRALQSTPPSRSVGRSLRHCPAVWFVALPSEIATSSCVNVDDDDETDDELKKRRRRRRRHHTTSRRQILSSSVSE